MSNYAYRFQLTVRNVQLALEQRHGFGFELCERFVLSGNFGFTFV
jgi:hypothetical protein